MKLKETLRIVCINILQNKFKVMLTSLGIIVGTITIVLVIAIGRGGEEAVASQFKGLSAETIYVEVDYTKEVNYDTVTKLTLEHLEQIKDEGRSLNGVYIRKSIYQSVNLGGEEEYISTVGVSQDFDYVSNYKIALGDTITEDELEKSDRVVVIGNKIAKKYFGTEENAINQQIKIGDNYYLVIGVLERTEEGMYGVSPDESIFMPITTMDTYFQDSYTLAQIVGVAKSLKQVESAKKEIKSTLNYILDDAHMYRIEDAGSRIDAATKSARTMKLLLVSVATIVFIVGGIGIMNVLFVSVKERTKEIGILKALGSSRADIMSQFLIESILVGMFGGSVGVILSYLILPLMKYTDIAVLSTVSGPIIAFMFAVVTATIFGFYPAYKASQLKPIQALNQD